MHLKQSEIFERLVCVEFGYKQCEKGNNLQMALAEAKKVLGPSLEEYRDEMAKVESDIERERRTR